MEYRLPIDQETLIGFCRAQRTPKLSFFGSVVRVTARPDGDVVLPLGFHPGTTPELVSLAALENEIYDRVGRRDHR